MKTPEQIAEETLNFFPWDPLALDGPGVLTLRSADQCVRMDMKDIHVQMVSRCGRDGVWSGATPEGQNALRKILADAIREGIEQARPASIPAARILEASESLVGAAWLLVELGYTRDQIMALTPDEIRGALLCEARRIGRVDPGIAPRKLPLSAIKDSDGMRDKVAPQTKRVQINEHVLVGLRYRYGESWSEELRSGKRAWARAVLEKHGINPDLPFTMEDRKDEVPRRVFIEQAGAGPLVPATNQRVSHLDRGPFTDANGDTPLIQKMDHEGRVKPEFAGQVEYPGLRSIASEHPKALTALEEYLGIQADQPTIVESKGAQ